LTKSVRQVAFVYNGYEVCFDEQRFIDVTQMWRAHGSPPNRRFADWVRTREGLDFVEDLRKSKGHKESSHSGYCPPTHLYTTTPGFSPTTYAHWQIALAYAKYLSPEFHRYVNTAFKEWAEEKANPDLKVVQAIQVETRPARSHGPDPGVPLSTWAWEQLFSLGRDHLHEIHE
jgi:hypothetical protein